jgi:putative addiction module killer protein
LKNVLVFKDQNGVEPFEKWVATLAVRDRAIIDSYIDRVALGGSLKNVKSLKDGLFEIKINVGPGYRVYFAYLAGDFLLLIYGGDKMSQRKDILKAKKIWRNYAQK